MMSMTQEVRDELGRSAATHPGCRRVQVAAIVRMAGEVRVTRNGLIVEIDVANDTVARYLRREIPALYGPRATISVHSPTGLRKGARYMVRVADGGTNLARETGMIDTRGRMVAGLPSVVVGGSPGEIAAAWRGAFLVAGTLNGPGKSTSLEIGCPNPEVAYALASCARRLGVQPIVREARGVNRVVIRDTDHIGALLTRLGADESRIAWERRVTQRNMQSTAIRLVNLDDANARRSARAAAATASRVQWALSVLGAEAPSHLADTGQLRIAHREASLEELGQLAEPPITKDAVAGRLRRLLSMASKRAAVDGLEDTDQADIGHDTAEPALAGA